MAQALTYLVCGDRSEPLEDLRDLRLGRARGGHDGAGGKGPLSLLPRRGELKLEGREQVNGHATTKGEGQLEPTLQHNQLARIWQGDSHLGLKCL